MAPLVYLESFIGQLFYVHESSKLSKVPMAADLRPPFVVSADCFACSIVVVEVKASRCWWIPKNWCVFVSCLVSKSICAIWNWR